MLPLLWLAVVVVTPIGEEPLFRGFRFRGWLRSAARRLAVIIVTALLLVDHPCAIRPGYVIAQVFVSGLMLGLVALGDRLDAFDHPDARPDQRSRACWRPCSPRTIDARETQSARRCWREGRMLVDAGRQARQADDVDAIGKARDAGDRVVEFDRVALAFATTIAAIVSLRCASTSSAVSVWLMVPR